MANVTHKKKGTTWETKFALKMELPNGLSTEALYLVADLIRDTVDIPQQEFILLSRRNGIRLKPQAHKLLVTLEGRFEAKQTD